MNKILDSFLSLLTDMQGERTSQRHIPIFFTLIGVFWGIAGIAIWPVVYELIGAAPDGVVIPVILKWICPALILINLIIALGIPMALYRPLSSAVGCYILNFICFLLLLMIQPVTFLNGMPETFFVTLMHFLLSFTISSWLAVLPACAGAILGWVFRALWIAIFRG